MRKGRAKGKTVDLESYSYTNANLRRNYTEPSIPRTLNHGGHHAHHATS